MARAWPIVASPMHPFQWLATSKEVHHALLVNYRGIMGWAFLNFVAHTMELINFTYIYAKDV